MSTDLSFFHIKILQIVSSGPTPEWDEAFTWAFDSPPKGQKLRISCKNKSKFGKVKLHTKSLFYFCDLC